MSITKYDICPVYSFQGPLYTKDYLNFHVGPVAYEQDYLTVHVDVVIRSEVFITLIVHIAFYCAETRFTILDKQHALPKRVHLSTRLYGITTQKTTVTI